MNSEERRARFPQNGELERLVAALQERGDLASRFYMLLLLTGARRGELEAMRWADVDLEARGWTKPSASTKQRKLHRLPLSPEAVAILTEIKATNPFAPFTFDEWRLRQAWREILAAANITNLRVHDLRTSTQRYLRRLAFRCRLLARCLAIQVKRPRNAMSIWSTK